MENNKELKTNWNGWEHLPAIGANPPPTRPPKAKMQIASALFHPHGFSLFRSCANDIWGGCRLCFFSFFTFQYHICDICDISHMRYWKVKKQIKQRPQAPQISFARDWDNEKLHGRNSAEAICVLAFGGRVGGGLAPMGGKCSYPF